MNHTIKVIRNALVLAFGYFVSTITEFEHYDWLEWRALVTFVGIYLAIEFGYYKILSQTGIPIKKGKNGHINPMIFSR